MDSTAPPAGQNSGQKIVMLLMCNGPYICITLTEVTQMNWKRGVGSFIGLEMGV